MSTILGSNETTSLNEPVDCEKQTDPSTSTTSNITKREGICTEQSGSVSEQTQNVSVLQFVGGATEYQSPDRVHDEAGNRERREICSNPGDNEPGWRDEAGSDQPEDRPQETPSTLDRTRSVTNPPIVGVAQSPANNIPKTAL